MRRVPPVLLLIALAIFAVACSSSAGAGSSAATPTATSTTLEAIPTVIAVTSTPPPAANEPKPTSTTVIAARPIATATQPPVVNDGPAPGGPALPPCCKPLVTPGAVPPTPPSVVNQATIASPPALIDRPTLAPAPIESLSVKPAATTGYAAIVQAGLPSGCAKADSQNVNRSGNAFSVTVTNSMPSGNVACTQIYGIYNLSIDLPGPFVSGQTYSVRVNDKSTSFTAQ